MDKTVLIIEDERALLDVLFIKLSPHFKVIKAKDGFDGIYKMTVNRDTINLVLLDITMPKINGDTVIEYMTQNSIDIPVVILSNDFIMDIKDYPDIVKKKLKKVETPINTIIDTIQELL